MTFPRVKPAGWALNELLTSAQLNQLDIDHANAVDGTGGTYTGNVTFNGELFRRGDLADYSLMTTVSGIGNIVAIAWAPKYTNFAGAGAEPLVVLVSQSGDQIRKSNDLINWSTPTITGGLSVGFAAIATNGAGIWLAAPNSASGTHKLYRSSDNGVNWSLTGDLPATPNGFRDVIWNSATSRFVVTGNASGYIATSDDGGLSWTQRTSALAVALGKIGLGSSGRAFILPNGASSSIQRSDDGITWTMVTMPSSQTWLSLARNPRTSALIASTQAGTFFKSTDNGLNWTQLTAALTAPKLVGFGPVILAGGITGRLAYTLDDGVTWEYVAMHAAAGAVIDQGVVVARNRIVACSANLVFASRCIGAADPLI